MIVIVWIWIFLGKITSPIYDKVEGKKIVALPRFEQREMVQVMTPTQRIRAAHSALQKPHLLTKILLLNKYTLFKLLLNPVGYTLGL